ncbi:MAG TPA: STAS domain-containing protein [Mycobacteriales bacterium]|nr:STAS domain-containing protein [Mycobacteriales bacterium]
MDAEVKVLADRRAPIVHVAGKVDLSSAALLHRALVDLIGGGSHQIVVDMAHLDFIDSTGLGVLVGACKRLRAEGGSLQLVVTSSRLLDLFRITGLTTAMSIHATVDAALAAAVTASEASHPS